MQIIKKVLISLFLIFVVGCQARLGSIEILNNIKVNDISGIYVRVNDSNTSHTYLTENDETEIIDILKELKKEDLKLFDNGVQDFDYSLNIETSKESYEILAFEPNKICINGKWYNLDEKITNRLCGVLRDITYYEK